MLRGSPQEAAFELDDARRDASHGETRVARARPSVRGRREREPAAADPSIAFLARSGFPPAAIARATAQAQATAISADRALLAAREIDADDFYRVLARRSGMAFVTAGARIAPGIDLAAAARAGIAPLARWPGGPRWIVAPSGDDIARMARWDRGTVVVTSPARLDKMLRAADPARIAEMAVTTLDLVTPGLSARGRVRPPVWPAVAIGAAMLAALCWLASAIVAAALFVALWAGFAAATVQRLLACFAGLEPLREPPALSDRDLPTYTIVVALYREANVAAALVRAIEAIDYPRSKLDVKFVVESDDTDTQAALAAAIPGAPYEIIVAPDGQPRTKPRALNVALPFARGELLTIFDAEDRPHRNQLRQAAAAFAVAPPDVACLQARLAIDNERKGWVQALYTLDYAALFGLFTPGLAFLDLPVFLGGSSNHFRRDLLTAVGGWDAWNVTEDADLGIRLARFGLAVRPFASQTGEEAPVTWRGFLGQRVRWKKGWLQTLAVHARVPSGLWRDLGPVKSLAVLTTFAAGLLGPLFWPLFVGALVWSAIAEDLFAPVGIFAHIRCGAILLLAWCGLLAMIGPLIVAALRYRLTRYLVCLPFLPLWHLALCGAAWLAVLEAFRAPYRWTKTEHGQAPRAPLS